MKHTNIYLRDDQKQVIEDIARESVVSEETPELSQSEAIRRLIDVGLEHCDDDLSALVSTAARIDHIEQRFMDEEGEARNKRTGFETQVKRHFKKRFENGYRPEQLEEWAENMRAKARASWHPSLEGDHEERRQQALEYVDALTQEAVEASDASEYDPLDPETVFSGYTGVEDGESREVFGKVVEDAKRRLRTTNATDTDAVATVLANKHDVTTDVAREAVQKAQEADAV